MKSKVAALILAHQGPRLLRRLAMRLGAIGIATYVSLDRNDVVEELREALEGTGATVILNMTRVQWGGFEIVDSTIRLIRAALKDQALAGCFLLSGDSYPLQPSLIDHIVRDGADHIEAFPVDPAAPLYARISKTYIPDTRIGALALPHKTTTERFVENDLIVNIDEMRSVYELKQKRVFPWLFAKGSQWWFMRRGTLERFMVFLDSNPDYIRWFKYSSVPDESFFATLALSNSVDNVTKVCPVYSDWSRSPSPFIFTSLSEAAFLKAQQRAFGRKFSDYSMELLDEIDKWQ